MRDTHRLNTANEGNRLTERSEWNARIAKGGKGHAYGLARQCGSLAEARSWTCSANIGCSWKKSVNHAPAVKYAAIPNRESL